MLGDLGVQPGWQGGLTSLLQPGRTVAKGGANQGGNASYEDHDCFAPQIPEARRGGYHCSRRRALYADLLFGGPGDPRRLGPLGAWS